MPESNPPAAKAAVAWRGDCESGYGIGLLSA